MLHGERTGAGVPVLLIHGFLGSARMWAPLTSHLASAFDVVAVDLPGFGRRTAQAAPDRMEGLAQAVIEVADSIGIERFHLVGHSMGGMVAQQIAYDWPDRVLRLVLYGTAASGRLPLRFEPITATIDRMRIRGVKDIGHDIVRSWFATGEKASGFAHCAAGVDTVTLATAVAALTAIDRWDLRPSLAQLAQECLVIGGDADRSTPPEELIALYRLLRHAELCVLPRCAHATHLERPDLFNEIVGRFLATALPSQRNCS